jgi:hypothetical protein
MAIGDCDHVVKNNTETKNKEICHKHESSMWADRTRGCHGATYRMLRHTRMSQDHWLAFPPVEDGSDAATVLMDA